MLLSLRHPSSVTILICHRNVPLFWLVYASHQKSKTTHGNINKGRHLDQKRSAATWGPSIWGYPSSKYSNTSGMTTSIMSVNRRLIWITIPSVDTCSPTLPNHQATELVCYQLPTRNVELQVVWCSDHTRPHSYLFTDILFLCNKLHTLKSPLGVSLCCVTVSININHPLLVSSSTWEKSFITKKASTA